MTLISFSQGLSNIVKFLLSRGAHIDALSVTRTPLSLVVFKGHASTIKILLQHNADVMFIIFFDLMTLTFNSLCWCLFATFSNCSHLYLRALLIGD